nr:DUF2147 domain-containing protein [Prolixibacteraceae bacterium]
ALGSVKAKSNIVGQWRTVDDGTGEVKSIVDIAIIDGKLFGTVIKLFNENPDYDPICEKCNDHLNGEKIIGLQIINSLTLDNGKWKGNDGILDPDNGKYYNCKMWVDKEDPDRLIVRGYIAFLYRTQTWYREKIVTEKQ